MEVSFTGLSNIYVGRKIFPQIGSYISKDGNIKIGNKVCSSIKLKCKLSDDGIYKDLTDFKNALAKAAKSNKENYIDPTNPDVVDLTMNRWEAVDRAGYTSASWFTLNGKNIPLQSDEHLGLFTYIAKLTRRLLQTPGMTEPRKECVKTVNSAIQDEAVKYLELSY